ncbi:hypothetical protein DXG01_008676, partial [Tephrocybe rancida]
MLRLLGFGAPEQCLGNCAICMDAIITKTRNIASEKEWDEGRMGLLSGFQEGIESSALDVLLEQSN